MSALNIVHTSRHWRQIKRALDYNSRIYRSFQSLGQNYTLRYLSTYSRTQHGCIITPDVTEEYSSASFISSVPVCVVGGGVGVRGVV